MHPRNIYNTRLDFKSMAHSYPEFKRHIQLDVNGKVRLDFKDPEALRALAKVLLKKDFNLDIEIPINSLIPTIPLRLNYILFIEDLLTSANINTDVIGIDIGTGASCIYPLLTARKNNWKMVATDCNSVNLKYATNNVSKNGLEEYIKVIPVSGQNTLEELLDKDDVQYTFCMCNPPFFQGIHELSSQHKARKPDRRKPNNAFCSSPHEVITEGGEVSFVTKIVTESHTYKNRIKIFTTMLGIKSSLKPITNMLQQSEDVQSYIQTEFFQGHTMRWGIAWTFQENINLKEASEPATSNHIKKKKPFIHSQPYTGKMDAVGIRIEEIFKDLQIQYKVVRKQDFSRLYNIVAHFNTWSHNRQKRREKNRIAKIMESVIPDAEESNDGNEPETGCTDVSMDASLEDVPTTATKNTVSKRKLSESDEDLETAEVADNKKVHVQNPGQLSLGKPIRAAVYVHLEDNMLMIEVDSLTDNTNRDSIHQILQYIKNHIQLA